MVEWNVVARRLAFDAAPWLRLWMEDLQLPDGKVVEDFATLEMPDYVVVVALTAEDDAVVTRNYKHGTGRCCTNLPAGYIDPGEEPLHAAQRELLEETGYTAGDWETLGSFVTDGNRGSGTAHLFLARDARYVTTPNSGDLEEMSVELMRFETLVQATRDGEVAVVSNAAAIGLAAVRLLRR